MGVRKTDFFAKWIVGLRDIKTRAQILVRIEQLLAGNPGDAKPIGEGVSELRINIGSGYRVYFKQQGQALIILLAGGDKSTQSKYISMALKLARQL